MTPYWPRAIAAARKRGGGFTRGDWDKATEWTTCACGRQDPRIPRKSNGAPVDGLLGCLGVKFTGAVTNSLPDEAERILGLIESRSRQILSGVHA